MNVFLVGYRCVGKTAVGRLLASDLGWAFVDMDGLLAADEGKTIQEIIAHRGWAYFREQESRLLRRLGRAEGQVVATGGGVVVRPENIRLMRQSGRVIWLKAAPAVIAARMSADEASTSQRPALRGKTALAEIEEVLEERLPLYRRAKHYQVETDNLSIKEVAEQVRRWLDETGQTSGR